MSLRYLPNIITCLRIVLVGPIIAAIAAGQYRLACYLFVLAGLSDGLDGFLARRFNWGSRFGSIADPLADKILLMGCFISLAWKGIVPLWLPVLILLRDLWVIAGAVSYHYFISPYDMSPTLLSKINTFLQILYLFLTLINLGITAIKPAILTITLWLTILACVLSWIDYTYVWGRKAWLTHKTKDRG